MNCVQNITGIAISHWRVCQKSTENDWSKEVKLREDIAIFNFIYQRTFHLKVLYYSLLRMLSKNVPTFLSSGFKYWASPLNSQYQTYYFHKLTLCEPKTCVDMQTALLQESQKPLYYFFRHGHVLTKYPSLVSMHPDTSQLRQSGNFPNFVLFLLLPTYFFLFSIEESTCPCHSSWKYNAKFVLFLHWTLLEMVFFLFAACVDSVSV